MNLAQKYTDEIYFTRLELEKQMSIIGMNALWNEIMKYRQTYRYEVIVLDLRVHFVLTPAILSKIQKANEQLKIADSKPLFQRCETIIDATFLTAPTLIQLYLITQLSILYEMKDVLFFIHDDFKELAALFETSRSSIFNEDGCDHTKPFLECISQVGFLYEQKMVQFKKKVNTEPLTLQQIYPHLSKKQCLFYATHQQEHYYYDVSDYVAYFHCSYETGRQHLLALAKIGLYEKKRVGKRDVYTVMV